MIVLPPSCAVLVVGVAPDAVPAFLDVVRDLPWPLPRPVVAVIQGARAEELQRVARVAPRPILVAWDRQPLGTSAIHVAPDGYHLLIEPDGLALSPDAPEHGARPAISPLFESAVWAYGLGAHGVLLGDTGPDGDAAAAALPGTARLAHPAASGLVPSPLPNRPLRERSPM